MMNRPRLLIWSLLGGLTAALWSSACVPVAPTSSPTSTAGPSGATGHRGPHRRAPLRKPSCRVVLNLDRGRVADVRIKPKLLVTLGLGTVLRQGKATYEIWLRQKSRPRRAHRYYIEAASKWQTLMARKLPKGKPFVLRDSTPEWVGKANYGRVFTGGDRNKLTCGHTEQTWIQGTFGNLVSIRYDGSTWQSGWRGTHNWRHKLLAIRGAVATKPLLTTAALKLSQRIWKAFLQSPNTLPWLRANTAAKDASLFRNRRSWQNFSFALQFPMAPDRYAKKHRGRRFLEQEVLPSSWPKPGLFLQRVLILLPNIGLVPAPVPFAVRILSVPRPLQHFAPKPGTTRISAPNGCAAVDLQTNEVVLPSGRRHRLKGVTRIIGVAWIPDSDPFGVHQLKAAFIEAEPSLRRARAYAKKQQLRKTAEHYLHGGRLLAVGKRFRAAAKVFRRALALSFRRKRLRVQLLSELGLSLFAQNKLDPASRAYRQGLALKPGFHFKGALLYNLGRIAEQRGQIQKAVKLYRRSVMVRANRAVLYRLRRLIKRLRRKPARPAGP